MPTASPPRPRAGTARAGTSARRRRGRSRLFGAGLAAVLPAVVVVALAAGVVPWLRDLTRATTPGATPYAADFRAAARAYPDVPAAQLAAQARAESGFDPRAVSPAGAQGLMQIVPATFARFAVDGDRDGRKDPLDPQDSIWTAAAYLHYLGGRLDLAPSDARVVAAYNAGPGAVLKAGGVPRIQETQTYVQRVMHWVPQYGWLDEGLRPARSAVPATPGVPPRPSKG
ncbi:MAG: lytic transglycosylase domain-containing protein [Motilibacteraceae bacterium]